MCIFTHTHCIAATACSIPVGTDTTLAAAATTTTAITSTTATTTTTNNNSNLTTVFAHSCLHVVLYRLCVLNRSWFTNSILQQRFSNVASAITDILK